MPATSKKQAIAARIAYAAKTGKFHGKLRGASAQMAKSMSLKQLKHYFKTKRKSRGRVQAERLRGGG